MLIARIWIWTAVIALIAGCASDVARTAAVLSPPAATSPQRIEIAQETAVLSSSNYSRVLPAGSAWELRGTLPQGSVYRRLNDVFTIEGAHVHEAYLVIRGNQLVGDHLPVEKAYSPAEPVSLN